jgi:hypothetical protein
VANVAYVVHEVEVLGAVCSVQVLHASVSDVEWLSVSDRERLAEVRLALSE